MHISSLKTILEFIVKASDKKTGFSFFHSFHTSISFKINSFYIIGKEIKAHGSYRERPGLPIGGVD
jgi:hypothetical protein